MWRARDAKKCIIITSELDNKYSRGVLGIITGSAKFLGAAVLTTARTSATGLGMIRFHSSSGLAHLVLHSNLEVVVQPGAVTAWLAGSGDVLAGIMGALVATNYIEILNHIKRLSQVATSAVFIHNSAALLTSRDAPISAKSIIEAIPNVMRKIT